MPGPREWLEVPKKVWWFIRQVSGDAAYENYLRYATRHDASGRTCGHCANDDASAAVPITAQEFYLEEIRRKFSRINRCC